MTETTFLNTTARRLKPSETLAIKAKIETLRAAGKKVIDLCSGEPEIDTPDHIKEAALKAMKDGHTKYTAVAGIAPLRQALAETASRDQGRKLEASNVIVTNGGKHAIHEAFEVCLAPQSEVIIPAPYWVSYPVMVEIAGAKPVILETAGNGLLTPDGLARAIGPKTAMLILNSPSNPSGACYTAEAFRALGAVLRDSKVLILSDEVYDKLRFNGQPPCAFVKACPELADRTITINAFSKTYAMTGWRVGYAIAAREIVEAMARYQSQTTSNINSIAQHAALAALKGPQDFIPAMVTRFERRIASAMERFSAIPGVSIRIRPQAGFFIFVDVEGLKERLIARGTTSSTALVDMLIETAQVAGVPGDAFGSPWSIRISVAAPDEQVEQGISRLCQVLGSI